MTSDAEVEALLHQMQREQRLLREKMNTLMWHMRGGLTREDAWTLSHAEREDIVKMIEERIKIVEKTRMPLL